MDVIVRVPTPVGLVRWANQLGTFSLVVKLTYDLPPNGWATLAERQQPLSEGEAGPSGLPLYPSDFVVLKRACDVVVAGRALLDHKGPMRLIVGGVDRLAQQAAALGPINSGDDSCAAPQQRMPFPALPLAIAVEWGRGGFRSTIGGPPPDAALIQEGGALVPVALRIDTILVEPGLGACSVVYRGSFTYRGDVHRGARLVVDALGGLSGYPARELERWPRMLVEVSDDAIEGDLEVTRDFVPSDVLRHLQRSNSDAPPSSIPRAPPSFHAEETVRIDRKSLGLEGLSLEHTTTDDPDQPLVPFSRTAARTVPMRSRAAATAQPAPRAPPPTTSQFDDEQTAVSMEFSVAPGFDMSPGWKAPRAALPFDGARTAAALPFERVRSSAVADGLPFKAAPAAATEARPAPAAARPAAPPVAHKTALQSMAEEITASDAQVASLPDSDESTIDVPLSDRLVQSWNRDAAAADAIADRPALPFHKTAPRETAANARDTIIIPTPVPPAPALSATPFVAATSPGEGETVTLPPAPVTPATSSPEPITPPTLTEDETFVGLTPAAMLSVTPFVTAAPIARDAVAAPAPAPPAAALSATPFVAAVRTVAVSSAPPLAAPSAKIMGFTLAEFTELRAKIAGDKSRRREHLKAHGLTALKWRELERAWADEIGATMADPRKVKGMLANMRGAGPPG